MKKEYTYKGQTIVKSGSGWASIGAEFCISVYVWAKTLDRPQNLPSINLNSYEKW
jgi:hypothetical protein